MANSVLEWTQLNVRAAAVIVLIVMVFTSVSEQAPCEKKGCYPQTGDLMVGRASNLTATSTCGLTKPQRYCIVSYLREKKKCYYCFAKDPQFNHLPKHMISTFDSERFTTWWQSENGKEQVTLQLDLEAQFHFTHLIMTFKTYRPAGMVLERSNDYGRTWQVYRYYAANCKSTFPGIPEGPQRRNSDIICTEEYSAVSPSTGGEVIFRALNPQIPVRDPYSTDVIDLLKLTNLRIHLTKLHTLGDNLLDPRPEIIDKYYYSVYELVVRGSCSCYGHAERCLPSTPDQAGIAGMVYGRCDCTHNTEGFNCEKCKKGYEDRPWGPAYGDLTNECVKCDCNGHATECRFDEAVYLASNKTSGGVCLNCSDNTFGRKCEKCKPLHYQDPKKDFTMPGACIPCNCDSIGGAGGGECEGKTDPAAGLQAGRCICKKNVGGIRCDRCKPGFFDLTSLPEGCKPCTCHPNGTIGFCDSHTGICTCRRNTKGKNCDICALNHYGLGSSSSGCSACDCDVGGSLRPSCDQVTGQCHCRKGITGRRCDKLLPGNYFALLDHLTYEAENAKNLGIGRVIKRQRPQSGSATWTGEGFVEVDEGTMLENVETGIPSTGVYNVLIRYESQDAWEWRARVDISRLDGKALNTSACGNNNPQLNTGSMTTTLSSRRSYSLIQPGICLEKGVSYIVKTTYTRAPGNTGGKPVLIDSVVLVPSPYASPVFQGPDGQRRRQQFTQYRCLEYYHLEALRPRRKMPETCKSLIFSLTAIIYDGGLACACDPAGTVRDISGSVICEEAGGQCRCKNNVIGQRCDRCAPGSYGFGLNGCSACDCDEFGSVDNFCNIRTGQCTCRIKADGRQCNLCPASHWGFPTCQPCLCNNHSPNCDPKTGVCKECQHDTTGDNCENCKEGFYGDATQGTLADCTRCRCPGGSSGNQFSKSCRLDSSTTPPSLLCDKCEKGYTGNQCEECADGYYGNPLVPGGSCKPCECNNNTNPAVEGNCDRITGRCNRCLYDTTGFSCERCKPGYHGNALARNCTACVCHQAGQDPTFGQSCDHVTGQCTCRPNVEGIQCNRCAKGYWNLASGKGCQKCDCCADGARKSGCNQLDGKCQCRNGFGGPRCCECEHGYWGKAPNECKPCDCNAAGSVSLQCDYRTGKCRCKAGTIGDKCDRCGVDTQGRMPQCEPCGECYYQWKVTLDYLSQNTSVELARALNLSVSGPVNTKAYEKELKALEERLEYVREILDNQMTSGNDTKLIEERLEAIARRLVEIKNVTDRVGREVSSTISSGTEAEIEIERLRRKLKELIDRGEKLEKDVRSIRDSDARGAYESLTESQRRSRAAERRVNASEIVIRQSKEERNRQEVLRKYMPFGDFGYAHGMLRNDLDNIWRRIRVLMNQSERVNEIVCGTPSEKCGGCGPTNCSFCGGPGCFGARNLSELALRKAIEAEQAMRAREARANATLLEVRQLEGLVNMTRDAARDAVLRAMDAQIRAQNASERMMILTKDILAWLAQKYDDPYKIGDLANAVLNMTLSVTPEEIENLTKSIRNALSKLTNLDEIIEGTRQERADALELKRRAQKAKDDAIAVNEIVKNVTDALLQAKNAQEGARNAIEISQRDIAMAFDILRNLFPQLDELEKKVRAANMTCGMVKGEIPALKAKYEQNKLLVETVEEGEKKAFNDSRFAMSEALRLKKLYEEAQWKIDAKLRNISEAARRVAMLKRNATVLKDDLIKKLTIIRTIHQEEINYDALKENVKAAELEMAELLNFITQKANCYRDCNPLSEDKCRTTKPLSERQKEQLGPRKQGAK